METSHCQCSRGWQRLVHVSGRFDQIIYVLFTIIRVLYMKIFMVYNCLKIILDKEKKGIIGTCWPPHLPPELIKITLFLKPSLTLLLYACCALLLCENEYLNNDLFIHTGEHRPYEKQKRIFRSPRWILMFNDAINV